MIVYSKNSGQNNAMIGKLETPLKMIIEHESDLLKEKNSIQKSLFNVERSKKFGETIVGNSEFGIFSAAAEGAGAENDSIQETFRKFIEHIQFMKEFTITAEMMEDANYGVAADAKRRAENFTRAYYMTMNRICSAALINGDEKEMTFAKANVNLTAPDGLPLFHKAHKYHTDKMKSKTQANYFYNNGFTASTDGVETMLNTLSNKIRNMRDENGEVMGYVADTIILPGNCPDLEAKVKKVCGSERTAGSANNDINIQYGNWNLVVLPDWQAERNEFMVMSSEANRNLNGNMFFNRVPLTVSNWVDHHTGNYIWTGRCRFGVGFGSWKHISKIVDATSLTDAVNLT